MYQKTQKKRPHQIVCDVGKKFIFGFKVQFMKTDIFNDNIISDNFRFDRKWIQVKNVKSNSIYFLDLLIERAILFSSTSGLLFSKYSDSMTFSVKFLSNNKIANKRNILVSFLIKTADYLHLRYVCDFVLKCHL